MKNLLRTIFAPLAMAILFFGCDDILEPEIYNQIEADQFPQTESDVLSSFIPFYAQFNPNYGNLDPSRPGGFDFSLTASYLGYTWASSIQTDENLDIFFFPIGQFTIGPATTLNSSGEAFYNRVSYIAKLTNIIDRIENSDINNKEVYAAEARSLRALFMYVLYDLYGPVSVKLDPATVDNNDIQPRLSQEAYTNAIEEDLTLAIADLPDRYNNTNNWGRISKGVARMILLKLYMHDKRWSEAKAVGTDIMSMGYNLNNSYKDVFTEEQNDEIIFAIPGSDGTTNIWFECMLPFDAKFVLDNDVTNGSKYKLVEMPWVFYDTYTENDTRLETIADSYITNTGQTKSRGAGLSGAIPMKYTDFVENGFGFDFVLYRYSDVLLAMAEITNELDGPTSEAQGYLTQVTDRAGTTETIPASALSSQDDMRTFILAERGRELYWEFGIRRQDLIRNGTFIENAQNRGISTAEPYKVLFPIPADVVIESGGIIEQNPGY